ncbi:HAMP domain-containing histidine kinase [Paracrocinitomix mangrovi]|uniref:sensor histidine kinase n=1 Tax=Paracrocinitomix mangrovi TaxID=2862509 RepID=UPI001C8E2E34|nr:HAMP domain-containing sensor histidine kinase [Paracrocinitomix mangrovi]UKN03531.1 HAMP domain-containing histidine kinase [Paracrocinitomix mangrovi]
MVRKRLKNPVFLFYILVGYVIIQFSWWLFQLFGLYKKIYTHPDQLKSKTWMLLGEGLVFLIILLGGVYMIRRALKREREINELQQNFLQSVSHELKTPLASIGLFLETIRDRDLSEEKKKDACDRALSEVKRLNHLISDILTARNIDSSNYFIHKEKIDLDDYINKVVNSLKDTLMVDYTFSLSLDEITIDLDKEALDSIVYNILENASKYAPKGSKVSISLTKKSGKTILQISDEGIGLDAAAKERVFNKFYRVENEMTRKSKGTGLGLYIVKFLVETQGGKIKLLDNKPQGLTVEIQFNE